MTLCEHSDSTIVDGKCLICKKMVPWHRLTKEDSTNQEVEVNKKIASFADKTYLRNASEEVIRISKIFKTIGYWLNILNYAVAVLIIALAFFFGSQAANGGFTLLVGLLSALIIWGLGWIQIAIIRGISAYFLMKGLSEISKKVD